MSGADVFSPYLGEAEAAVRHAFLLARNASPAILFFDEIDAIVCKREGGGKVRNLKSNKLGRVRLGVWRLPLPTTYARAGRAELVLYPAGHILWWR